ncbi:hypothetical protein C9J03_06140 [Photobacterium gaetbulicola]|uniref:hypothetical protein n=1 Tax=Photobacterium gaetbulicola TaxID=1295392 RepID=UPI0005CBF426|nr:hypothetical protein [Photobacterium gaetbulicola]PSU13493.1 hypothetical protein C9J03_06140 [Photobacterium gaetbulicola]
MTGANKQLGSPESHGGIQPDKMSMHEGVADWCDCCVCEAEPYWLEVAEEMGIDMSNYSDGR